MRRRGEYQSEDRSRMKDRRDKGHGTGHQIKADDIPGFATNSIYMKFSIAERRR